MSHPKKTQSRIGLLNENFIQRVKPELDAWGLAKHPNPKSYFHKESFGYRYDFADTCNVRDIKIAVFAIFHEGPSLWIKGLKTEWTNDLIDLPIIFDSLQGVFTLTRNWSILHPLNICFEYKQKSNETVEGAAERLTDHVLLALPKLHKHLYG